MPAYKAPLREIKFVLYDVLKADTLANAVPAYETQPPRFMIKLLAAWVTMGFRRPKITW